MSNFSPLCLLCGRETVCGTCPDCQPNRVHYCQSMQAETRARLYGGDTQMRALDRGSNWLTAVIVFAFMLGGIAFAFWAEFAHPIPQSFVRAAEGAQTQVENAEPEGLQ